MSRVLVAVAFVTAPLVASADPAHLDSVARPPQHPKDAVLENEVLYLNNCAPSGCAVHPGTDDAQTNTSEIATIQGTMQPVAWTGTEWADIVQCVKEVYSPYNITITDVKPSTSYNEVIVAGAAADIGYNSPGAGGVAPVSFDCSPYTDHIAFVFGDQIDTFAQEDAGSRVWGTCWTISQESAHLYGLDHEYQFTDNYGGPGNSTCNDPMTYRAECGGQKFFRNHAASCGEFGPARPGCGPSNNCSTAQNSHAKLLNTLGAGTVLTTPPTVSITLPLDGSTITSGTPVQAKAFAQRGVSRLELWLNGHKWAEAPGAQFGSQGQLESTYPLNIPSKVPDSVIDIVVKAYDDIEKETDSATVTVTKGAPCTSASTCLTGQKCDAGKCYWDPPSGMLGDVCTYDEFCITGICSPTQGTQYCTQSCIVGSTGACPMGYECDSAGNGGLCLPIDNGGCCSVSNERHALWIHGGLAAFVLGLLFRRKRR